MLCGEAGDHREKNMSWISIAVRRFAIAVVAVLSFGGPSYAQTPPSGEIRIEIISAGFIVGVSGGSGTLIYQGKRYPLSIGGVNLGAIIGASKAELSGRVYNLRKVSDIAGTYGETEAGYAVVTGRKAARLKNTKGVVLVVRGRQVGLEISLNLSGMQVSLR
jgi:hypothetical protein